MGNAARKAVDAQGNVKNDYIPVSQIREALKNASQGTTGPAVTTLMIQDPRNGKTIEVVKRKEAEAAGVKTPPAKSTSSGRDWNAYEVERRADEKAKEDKADAQTQLNLAALRKVREAAIQALPGVFEQRLIAQVMLNSVAYFDMPTLLALHNAADRDALEKEVFGMSLTQLDTLMLDCVLVKHVRVFGYGKPEAPQQMLAAAAQYGVDVEAVRSAYPPEMPDATHADADAEVTA